MEKFGISLPIQMLDGANKSIKVFFNREQSVSNIIVGLHPGLTHTVVKPSNGAFFQLRYESEKFKDCSKRFNMNKFQDGGQGVIRQIRGPM